MFSTESVSFIEVSIVWLGIGHIHAKGIATSHDARNVAHHAHAVKRGLTVEEDGVAVHQMTVHDVALVQHDGVAIRIALQRDFFAVAFAIIELLVFSRTRRTSNTATLLNAFAK
mgnify:CR=1 FL=1